MTAALARACDDRARTSRARAARSRRPAAAASSDRAGMPPSSAAQRERGAGQHAVDDRRAALVHRSSASTTGAPARIAASARSRSSTASPTGSSATASASAPVSDAPGPQRPGHHLEQLGRARGRPSRAARPDRTRRRRIATDHDAGPTRARVVRSRPDAVAGAAGRRAIRRRPGSGGRWSAGRGPGSSAGTDRTAATASATTMSRRGRHGSIHSGRGSPAAGRSGRTLGQRDEPSLVDQRAHVAARRARPAHLGHVDAPADRPAVRPMCTTRSTAVATCSRTTAWGRSTSPISTIVSSRRRASTGAVGVAGRQRTLVARVHGLQHVERLAGPDLPDHDAIRSHAQRRPHAGRGCAPRRCPRRWRPGPRAARRVDRAAGARPRPRW